MDTKALRQKILDLAIRGKLVPQDPNDEPASVLLERIREQKKQMVKEGKLKEKDIKNDTVIFVGEDNSHYEKFPDGTVKCIEDEIPFEVPEGWAWCRLKSVAAPNENSFVDGPFGSNLKTEHYTENKEVRIIQLNNIGELTWKDTGVKYTTFKHAETLKRCKSYPGDIVIAKMMPAGRTIIIPNINNVYVISSDCVRLQLPEYISNEYIMYMLNSNTINNSIMETIQGIGRSRTSLSKLKEILIPLPCLMEQQRIVKKICELFKYTTDINDNVIDMLSFINIAKSKILDLAIRGKLVPQDLNDEPASVLLERIRAEKEELIKQGKIKRDKKESVIFKGDDNSYFEKIGNNTFDITDSIPFEIPDTWIWCRLKSVASNEDNSFVDGPFGSDLKTIHYTDKEEVRIVQLNNIGEEGWKDARKKYTTFLHAENIERCISFPEDIVIAKMMPAGRAIILPSVNSMYVISSDCIRLRADYRLHKDYLMFMLNSPSINKCVLETVQGIGRTRTSLNKMKDILIPVPPKSEQQKICKKLTMCFDYLTSIYNSLMITT